jgi:hypothetical protein
MARLTTRVRARSARMTANQRRAAGRHAQDGGLNASVVPRVLVGAVDGIEIMAVGALELARNVLVGAVSGAANIGVEAVAATVTGTRGVVTAASQAVADIARSARGTVLATVDNARHAGRDAARSTRGRASASVARDAGESAIVRATNGRRRRGAAARPRAVSRPARPSVAA